MGDFMGIGMLDGSWSTLRTRIEWIKLCEMAGGMVLERPGGRMKSGNVGSCRQACVESGVRG